MMDRLTVLWNGLAVCNADAAMCKKNNPSPKYDADCCCDCPRQQDIYNRLATYEDIGTVDELAGLKAQLEQVTAERDALAREAANLGIDSINREKRLARVEAEVERWAQAEAAGRLVVLPCKPGDIAAEKALYGPCHGCIHGDDRFDNPCAETCDNYSRYEAKEATHEA